MKRLFIICLIVLTFRGYIVAQQINSESHILFNIEDIDNYSPAILPYLVDYFYHIAQEECVNGQITTAITYSKKALYIIKERLKSSHPKYIALIRILALSLDRIGDYDHGLKYHLLEAEYIKNIGGEDILDYAYSQMNLALCYCGMRDFKNALIAYNIAIPIIKSILGDNDIVYAIALGNFAVCLCESADYVKATEYYEQALAIYKNKACEDFYYGNLCCNLAYCHYRQGDYNAAINLCEYGLNIISKNCGDMNEAYINHQWNLSMYYYTSKNIVELIRSWSRSLKTTRHYATQQLSYGLMTSDQRNAFWERTILDLDKYNSIFSNYLADSLNKDLTQKGQFLYDLFTGLSYNSLLVYKGGFLRLDMSITKSIRESGLESVYNSVQNETSNIKDSLVSRSDIHNNDILNSKNYLWETSFLKIKWRHVQNKLEKKDVAVEILAANEYIDKKKPQYYAALVLRKGWNAPKFIKLYKTNELSTYFAKGPDAYRDENSSKLYYQIWSKLEPYINEDDNIYFSPSGLLHQINVEVLKDATGRQANEKYNLFRVSSTRELCMKKSVSQWKTAALYGDLVYDVDSTMMLAQSRAYLPEESNNDTASRGFVPDSTHRAGWSQLSNTAEEVNAIDRLLSSKRIGTAKYMQYAGNEESFKALSGKKTSIIHLATHGFFFKDEETKAKPFFEMLDMDQHQYRPDNSLKRSGLILAGGQRAWLGEPIPDNVEDGILLAEEIAAMDLSGTDLVVLSACETGLGEITSEGVFGLQRAFKKAGVQTLVMSLWKVHDAATSLMMRTFYKNLLNGKSKRDAFAMAQQTVKEKYEDPYYWASFIMLD